MKLKSNTTGYKVGYYLTGFMLIVYFSLAILFLFTDIAQDFFSVYRKEFGVVLLVYATIRSFLLFRKIKQDKENNN